MKINITKILLVLLLISVTKPFSLKKRKIKRLSLKTPKDQADHDKLSFKSIKLSGIIKSENTFERTFSTEQHGLIIKEFICRDKKMFKRAANEIETMEKLKGCPFCLPKCGSSDPKEFEPTNPMLYLIFPSTEGSLLDFYKDEFEEFDQEYHLKDDNALNKRIEEADEDEEYEGECKFWSFCWFASEEAKERKVFVPTEEYKAKFETKLYQIIQMAMAVERLHRMNFVIRNIKLQNFLYFDIANLHKKVLLSDFSLLSDVLDEFKINKEIEGNVFYLPLIDLWLGHKRSEIKIDQKFDVFSLGVALFEVLVPELRERYFDRVDAALLSDKITTDRLEFSDAISEIRTDLEYLRELEPVSKAQREIENLLFKKVLVYWPDRIRSGKLLRELKEILKNNKLLHIWEDVKENYILQGIRCPFEVQGVQNDSLNKDFEEEKSILEERNENGRIKENRTPRLQPRLMGNLDVLRK